MSYNPGPMSAYSHIGNPLTTDEWEALSRVVRSVGDSTVFRRFIEATNPLGPGIQTVPTDTVIGITEGYKHHSEIPEGGIKIKARASGIIPIISKDFTLHWRDLQEARQTGRPFSLAKAAAAASSCARTEEKFILFGHSPLGHNGLMTVEGRWILTGLRWMEPGDAFENFTRITQYLMEKGHNGPYAAVVHPNIYANMHRIFKGSSFLEISHVRAILSSGVFKSSLLSPGGGLVISTGKQNFELSVSVETSVAFLGARKMNLPFRVFKAIYLRILRSDAICTF
jgi:uncharacterized linocin/CFP29 family protein